MRALVLRLFLFVTVSMIQVKIVDAKDYTIPTEDPKDCVKSKSIPCAISTGDKPRMFLWEENRFEWDRDIVAQTQKSNYWNVYNGMAVIEASSEITIHTPFADVVLNQSKVMVHVMENKVRVLSLAGRGVVVKPKGSREENFLVPGFQNWYGGVEEGESQTGVVSVIDIKTYSQARAKFFLNHQYGFLNEINKLASTIKWAAQIASQIHRELVERKMASLEVEHQEKIARKRRKIEFNKYLRRLFLKKVRYDY